jgi:hypothetical protein
MDNFNPNNFDVSQVGIQFGPDFDLDGKTSFNLQLSFSSDEIKKQTDLLKSYSKTPNDLFYSLVLEFPVDTPEIQTILSQALEGYLNNQGWSGRVETEMKNSVVLVLKLGPEKEEALLQPLKFLLGQGLNNICKENQSNLEVIFSSANDFKDFMPSLVDNESMVCTFLQSLKASIKLALAKNLIEGLTKVFDKIDPEFNNSPPMMLLKYFKSVDVDLRFQSTKELPQNVRNVLFYPEFIRGVSDDVRKLKAFDANVDVIVDKLGKNVKGFLVIPDFVVAKVDINTPNASVFVKEYFGLLNYFFYEKKGGK